MEAHPRQHIEAAALAFRAIAAACSGGHKKGADRAAAGAGKRPNCFSENLRTCLGGRGIRTYPLRTNSRSCPDPHGKVGKETQKTYGHKENSGLTSCSVCLKGAIRNSCLPKQ